MLLIIPLVFWIILTSLILDLISGKVLLVEGEVTRRRIVVTEDFTDYRIRVGNRMLSVSEGWYNRLGIGDRVQARRTRFSHITTGLKLND